MLFCALVVVIFRCAGMMDTVIESKEGQEGNSGRRETDPRGRVEEMADKKCML